MNPLDTINIILIKESKIVLLYAFPDTTEGEKAAREQFIRIASDLEETPKRSMEDWQNLITLIGEFSDGEGYQSVEFRRSDA